MYIKPIGRISRTSFFFSLLLMIASSAVWAQTASIGQAYNEIRVQLTPLRETLLSSEVGGRIDEVMVREGESFIVGQVLVHLDCTMHEVRLEKAEALLLEAKSIEQVSARLDQLGSISTLEYSSATARLAAAAAEVGLMLVIVERCVIKAPFPGKVVQLMARSHQFVTEGQELIEILDDSVMLVEMNVPSQWLESKILDQTLILRIEETGNEYPALIERIGARIDAVSQSVKLYGSVVGSYPELRSGMSGTAILSDQ